MQVRRIQVSEFRALRQVDLVFGADFDPQIFPLGSKNGGGKSTLLQLVFILLGCADHLGDSSSLSKLRYLSNLLTSFEHPADQPKRHVATITVELALTEGSPPERLAFEFESLNDAFLTQTLGEDQGDASFSDLPLSSQKNLTREYLPRLRALLEGLLTENRDPARIADERRPPGSWRRWEMAWTEFVRLQGHLRIPLQQRLSKQLQSFLRSPRSLHDSSPEELLSFVTEMLMALEEAERRLDESTERITHLLKAHGLLLLTTFHGSQGTPCVLVCRVQGRDSSDARALLRRAGKRTYMLGPTLQQYLFLPLDVRESLTHTDPQRAQNEPRQPEFVSSQRLTYLQALAKAEAELPGFHSYDWLSIEPLIELFRQARDRDFAMAVANGQYGDHYTRILADVNALLVGKRVRPEGDLSGLSFTVERRDGTESEIRLEDLSRGELKRLMIYAWLKTKGSGAVVLMDEPEVSLHPDWQLHFTEDLHQWAPDNQYILATHSYELCQALTPGHVRELDPPPGPRRTSAGSSGGRGLRHDQRHVRAAR